jgi:hypothetical protein
MDKYVMIKAWEKTPPDLDELITKNRILYHVGGFNNPVNKLKWMLKVSKFKVRSISVYMPPLI